MSDEVPRQCPQTATFEEKGEPKQIRTNVPLLTSQANTLPLSQTGSLGVESLDQVDDSRLLSHHLRDSTPANPKNESPGGKAASNIRVTNSED